MTSTLQASAPLIAQAINLLGTSLGIRQETLAATLSSLQQEHKCASTNALNQLQFIGSKVNDLKFDFQFHVQGIQTNQQTSIDTTQIPTAHTILVPGNFVWLLLRA